MPAVVLREHEHQQGETNGIRRVTMSSRSFALVEIDKLPVSICKCLLLREDLLIHE